MRYCRKERQRLHAERYLLFRIPNFRRVMLGVLLRLSTLTGRDPSDIIGTYCVYRSAVVIRGIVENRRHEGDVIVIRPDSPLDHVLLSLTALARMAL